MSCDLVGPSPLSHRSDTSAPSFNVRWLGSLPSSHILKRTHQRRREQDPSVRFMAEGSWTSSIYICSSFGTERGWRVGMGRTQMSRELFSYRNFIFASFLGTVRDTQLVVCMVFNTGNNGIGGKTAGCKGLEYIGNSRLPSRRAGCQTLSPQWSVGRGGGRWEEALGWSDIDI